MASIGVSVLIFDCLQFVCSETSPQVKEIRLISKEYLVPLYKKAGYQWLRPSPVVHGKEQWIEMNAMVKSKEELEILDRKRRTWYF